MTFVPIAYRYVGILRQTDTKVQHWWTILLLRFALVIFTTWNLQSLQCRFHNFHNVDIIDDDENVSYYDKITTLLYEYWIHVQHTFLMSSSAS
jgi:hypothetical protein